MQIKALFTKVCAVLKKTTPLTLRVQTVLFSVSNPSPAPLPLGFLSLGPMLLPGCACLYLCRPMIVSTATAGNIATVFQAQLLFWQSLGIWGYENCSATLRKKNP